MKNKRMIMFFGEYNEDINYLHLFDNLLKNKDLVYDIQKYVNNYSFNSFLKELDN